MPTPESRPLRRLAGRADGLALPVLLAVITVVLAVGAGLIQMATTAERTAGLERQAEDAFYAAESGLQHILAWVKADPAYGWRNLSPLRGTVQYCPAAGSCTGTRATYEVTFAVVSVGSPGREQVHVTSVGRAGNARRVITAKVEYNDRRARVVCFQCL